MKLAHLADPHLGFRQYHRQTPAGINQREADVANAFRDAIAGVIAAGPGAIVIAGDLFHSVRPTNAAIVFAFNQLARLRDALPGTPVILIAGNHDTPRAVETGSILQLFAELGVHVVAGEARRLEFPELELSVLAVPHQALVGENRPILEPAGGARYQVLLAHGDVAGVLPPGAGMEYGGATIDPAAIATEGWSYVALGHYHVQRPVGTRAWYAGSLEYVSTNPWGERREEMESGRGAGKGWLLVDLQTGNVERSPVRPARLVLDLDPVAGAGLTAKELDQQIQARLAAIEGGLDGKLVRLILRDVPRHVARELDHTAVRQAKATALHFHLDIRRPEPSRTSASGAPGRRRTLPEMVRDHLRHRPLPSDIEREQFVETGVQLIEAAERDLTDD